MLTPEGFKDKKAVAVLGSCGSGMGSCGSGMGSCSVLGFRRVSSGICMCSIQEHRGFIDGRFSRRLWQYLTSFVKYWTGLDI